MVEFFCVEYVFNVMIVEYLKLVVVFVDGIMMGGGIGFVGYVVICIVMECLKLVMLEMWIGFMFDVGGIWLFGWVFGCFGEYFGFMGLMMNGVDVVYFGFVDYFVLFECFDVLCEVLVFWVDFIGFSEIVLLFDEMLDLIELFVFWEWIDDVFLVDMVSGIVECLYVYGMIELVVIVEFLEGFVLIGFMVMFDVVCEVRVFFGFCVVFEGEYWWVLWFVNEYFDLVEGIRV